MANDDRATFRKLLAPGRVFEEKYRIVGPLGSGSFAHVLKARHEVMDRDVALKVLRPELVEARPEVVERFLNEVRIVSKLRHPNTVTVFDFGRTSQSISYLVMEYVEGRPLEDVLEEEGALEPGRVVHIVRQILKALAEAHELGIIHRDLKPSNIMLTELHGEHDFVKVLDFGVAKLVGPDAEPSGEFERRSTQFVGTPIYMSPEQVLGETVVPASDLYSLGLMVYEMLTGTSPIAAKHVAAVAQVHIDDDPIPFEALDSLTMRFQKLILRATSRAVDERFTHVRDFARQLPQVGGVEHSSEFSNLFLDEAAPKEAEPKKSVSRLDDEISEGTWEAFSGKNYIAPPEPDADEVSTRSPRPLPKPQPVARERAREDRPKPAPREPLAVDVGKVRRDEMRRDRKDQRASRQPVVWSGADSRLWLVAGAFALYVGFIVSSTVFVSANGPERWFVGLLPLGAAFLWTSFSGVRRLHGNFSERWAVPAGRYMSYTALVLLLFVAVTMPERAASRMSNDAAWFLPGDVTDGVIGVLVSFVELTGSGLAALFSFASRVLPW